MENVYFYYLQKKIWEIYGIYKLIMILSNPLLDFTINVWKNQDPFEL